MAIQQPLGVGKVHPLDAKILAPPLRSVYEKRNVCSRQLRHPLGYGLLAHQYANPFAPPLRYGFRNSPADTVVATQRVAIAGDNDSLHLVASQLVEDCAVGTDELDLHWHLADSVG